MQKSLGSQCNPTLARIVEDRRISTLVRPRRVEFRDRALVQHRAAPAAEHVDVILEDGWSAPPAPDRFRLLF
jgi:hypothetical protein